MGNPYGLGEINGFPTTPQKKIISPHASLPLDARVSDLIDEELHCWKNEVVN